MIIPAILLSALAILLLFQLWRLSDASKWVLHTDDTVDQARQIQTSLLDMESGMRGYDLAGRAEFLAPYKDAEPKLASSLEILEALTSAYPEQIERIKTLRVGILEWTDYAEQRIALRQNNIANTENLSARNVSGRSMMDKLRMQIEEIISVERARHLQKTQEFAAAQKTLIFFIVAAAFLLAILFSLFIRRQLTSVSKTYVDALEAEAAHIQELETERAMREMFVSTLSHDLCSPLTIVQVSARMLLESLNCAVDEREKIASRILRSAVRANRMIEDLLDANRIKAGEKLPLKLEALDLLAVAKKTIADLTLIHGERFALESNASGLHGYWSPDGLRRILENLCSNAVKYGASTAPITIRLCEVMEQAEISIHNHGAPLSPEEQIKIFEPFQRSGAAQSGGQKGWGLGLTLVQALVKAHGGKVKVHSSPGSGTTFTIRLPLDARLYSENAA